MEERHPKHGLVGEHVERVEIMVERVATLNADEGRMLARGSRRAELRGVPNVPHPRRLIEQVPKGSEVLLEHLPAAPRSSQRIGRDHPGGAAEPYLLDAWKIRVTKEPTAEEPAPVNAIEVVAEDSAPEERLDVEVDRVRAEEDLGSLLRDPERIGDRRSLHRNASLTRRVPDRRNPGYLAEIFKIAVL